MIYNLLSAINGFFFYPVLTILFFGIVIYVIMGWLFQFGTISRHDPRFFGVWSFLHGIIEPVVRPVRRYVPTPGGLDLPLMVVALTILFLRDFFIQWLIVLVTFGGNI
ncbi:MAG: YggT family protein [Pseudomonadota bacterium]